MAPQQRQQALIQLSRVLGNRRLGQVVALLRDAHPEPVAPVRVKAPAAAIMPYTIRLEGAVGARTPESVDSIRSQLVGWGISNPGDLNTINQSVAIARDGPMAPLTDGQIHQGMTILEGLLPGGGPRGAPGRVVRAWNRGLDDLGAGRRYPTILHFAVRLEQMAQASMNMSYLQAIQAMPTVRLAGLQLGVHPRAVYFVAAAQVGMDVAAGVQPNQGHYMAPGAFFPELRAIQRQARAMARPAPRRRAGAAAQPTPLDRLGVQAFNVMRSEVLQMVRVMEEQQSRGGQPVEHREPGLQRYLIPLGVALRALPEATTAEEARTLAGQLNQILGSVPIGQRTHGGGSIDPHGTAHALGLAIDLFNGTGSEGIYQNFGIPATHWPFLHLLMDEHPTAEWMRTLRPRAIHELTPEQAGELAALVQAHGRALANRLRPAAPEGDAAAQAAARRSARAEAQAAARARRPVLATLTQIRNRVLGGYFQRWQVLTMALSRSAWYRSAPEVRQVAQELVEMLRMDRRSFMNLSPAQVLEGLQARHARLVVLCRQGREATQRMESEAAAGVESEPESAAAGRAAERARRLAEQTRRRQARARAQEVAVLDRVDPGTGRVGTTLSEQLELLTAEGDTLQETFTAEREGQVQNLVSGRGFDAWLGRVEQMERPLYDQPRILVEALDQVASHRPAAGAPQTHFYGGHHWEVAPEQTLTSPSSYRESLQRDMSRRSPETMRRILTTMAESEGGRRILGGSDPDFRQALDQPPHGNAAGLMSQALASREAPAGAGGSSVTEFLRSRGFPTLAGEQSEGQNEAEGQPAP
jgi:hypothetical protein